MLLQLGARSPPLLQPRMQPQPLQPAAPSGQTYPMDGFGPNFGPICKAFFLKLQKIRNSGLRVILVCRRYLFGGSRVLEQNVYEGFRIQFFRVLCICPPRGGLVQGKESELAGVVGFP